MTSSNFFDVLGVSPKASDAEVKAAYHRKVKETHPDAGGDAASFREVQEAYETIGTASKRSLYTAWLTNAQQATTPSGPGLQDDMSVAMAFHQLDQLRAQAVRQLVVGLLWAIGAAGLTLITYASAKSGGGHYVILWGPIVFGAWRALKSISMMLKVAELRRHLEQQIRHGVI
jgi:DnaJ domain